MVLVQNVGAELHAMEADIKFSRTIDIGGGGGGGHVRTIYIHIYTGGLRSTVPLVWSSLRLAPTTIDSPLLRWLLRL